MPENGKKRIQEVEGLDVDYDTLPLTFMDKNKLYWKYIFLIPLAWVIHAINCWRKIKDMNIKDKRIYTFGDFFCNTIPAFLKKSKEKDIKWIVSVFHIIDSPTKRKGGHSFFSNFISKIIQSFSFYLIKNKADIIIVLNEDLKNDLAVRGFDRDKMYILGAGINYDFIDKMPSEDGGKYDACFMARLSTTKGILDMPDVWKKVRKTVKNARLVVIGAGVKKDLDRIKEKVLKNKLEDSFEMVGAVSDQEKYAIMKNSKVFVFPSYEEGFAISILEAMVCKIPVVAWNLSVYSTIYKDAIITVPKGDINSFSENVVKLLNDKNFRDSQIEKGLELAKGYDWKNLAKKGYEIINAS